MKSCTFVLKSKIAIAKKGNLEAGFVAAMSLYWTVKIT